ncbi:hypothetical protein BS78_K342100 [Paspalum vaginatum]|uniref:AAA+ ATPase domain-containing protein n=1 Tax=Paspalum vaginatum TaxID=158149 RepID=A0A9W7XCI5_9POAL|nr:hypothetical protein BS78_K342100 [Paspalum vaginatum]
MNLATGAIGSVISKLAELLKAECKLQTGVKLQVESLTHELESAHAFLQRIADVPPDQLDEQVKIWASEVREASYDMEDVLDTFLLRVKGPKPIKKNKLERLQQKMGSLFSKSIARHSIANAIDEVNKKVKEIAERRHRYKLDDRVASAATPSSSIDPRIALVHRTNVSLLIGIDERKDAVIKMLFHDDGMFSKKANIVSLLGFGGIGKTTLAKAIYDQLKHKFKCGAFVSIGRNPDLVKVYKDILFDLDKDKFKEIHSTQRGADLLIRELLEFLGNKRYLIVIDDVWEIQSRKRITEALPMDNIRSRIIITTRKLPVESSKKLFYTSIFGGEAKFPVNQQQEVPPQVADKIIRKCGGVPLAIITMASLLVGKSMQEWFDVCNSIGFRDKDKKKINDTMWILSLSYHDLPSHLKTCLLYLSIFPEDSLINKDALIWMWIGEGFVIRKPGIGLFEIGEGYFNDLIRCRVHDMVLDLIRSVSYEVNFANISSNGDDILLESNARRLAIQSRVVEDTPQDNHLNNARTRSLFAFRCSFGSWVQLLRFKLLRVLYIENCHPIQFDEHVADLLHLRCLVVLNSYYSELPKEIGALKFLQMLYLEDNISGLLPLSVGMLTQLVCLRALGMSLPGAIVKDLTSLQELQIWRDNETRGSLVLKTSVRRMDGRTQSDLLMSLGNLHKMQRLELLHGVVTGHEAVGNGGLPSCIDTSRLPNLAHLSLNVDSLSNHDLQIQGGLPELYFLELSVWGGRATLTGTTANGYFQKLRSCLLPDTMIQFVVSENSSVSFTIWHQSYDAPVFACRKNQYSFRVEHALMPNLEVLYFEVVVKKLTACNNGSCDNLGLECLATIQEVRVDLDCRGVLNHVVEKEVAALRHVIQVHPRQPILEIEHFVYMEKSYRPIGKFVTT